jgi:hypothetical protein
VAETFLTFVFDGIWGHVVGIVWRRDWARGKGPRLVLQQRRVLMRLRVCFGSQVLLGEVLKVRGCFGGSWGQIFAAWSMWFEKRERNCEARLSRSSVEAVDEVVLSMAAWREVVWLMRSGVLVWYSLMCCCERGKWKLYLRVEYGVRVGLDSFSLPLSRQYASR